MLNYKWGFWMVDLFVFYFWVCECCGGFYYGMMGNMFVCFSWIGFVVECFDFKLVVWVILQILGVNWYDWNSWGVFDV